MQTKCGNPLCSKLAINKYCSLSCANTINSKKRWEGKKKYPIYKPCKFCNKSMELDSKNIRRQFCNHSCSAQFSNKSLKNPANYPTCLNCNTEFKTSWRKALYCSTLCKQEHEIELWKSGRLDATRTYRQADFVRRHLEQRSNNTCENCGQVAWWNGKPLVLHVDHSDGNWQNNTYENLRLICPHCHTQTENWGARNKGNGRTWKKNYNQFVSK